MNLLYSIFLPRFHFIHSQVSELDSQYGASCANQEITKSFRILRDLNIELILQILPLRAQGMPEIVAVLYREIIAVDISLVLVRESGAHTDKFSFPFTVISLKMTFNAQSNQLWILAIDKNGYSSIYQWTIRADSFELGEHVQHTLDLPSQTYTIYALNTNRFALIPVDESVEGELRVYEISPPKSPPRLLFTKLDVWSGEYVAVDHTGDYLYQCHPYDCRCRKFKLARSSISVDDEFSASCSPAFPILSFDGELLFGASSFILTSGMFSTSSNIPSGEVISMSTDGMYFAWSINSTLVGPADDSFPEIPLNFDTSPYLATFSPNNKFFFYSNPEANQMYSMPLESYYSGSPPVMRVRGSSIAPAAYSREGIQSLGMCFNSLVDYSNFAELGMIVAFSFILVMYIAVTVFYMVPILARSPLLLLVPKIVSDIIKWFFLEFPQSLRHSFRCCHVLRLVRHSFARCVYLHPHNVKSIPKSMPSWNSPSTVTLPYGSFNGSLHLRSRSAYGWRAVLQAESRITSSVIPTFFTQLALMAADGFLHLREADRVSLNLALDCFGEVGSARIDDCAKIPVWETLDQESEQSSLRADEGVFPFSEEHEIFPDKATMEKRCIYEWML